MTMTREMQRVESRPVHFKYVNVNVHTTSDYYY